MAFFRVGLELKAPLGTPLHSGTLFGHLCWAYRWLKGESSLMKRLERLDSGHPFLISDGFPEGCVPRPVLAPAKGGAEDKRLRRGGWLRLQRFLEIRTRVSHAALNEVSEDLEAAEQGGPVRVAHNTIDRHTGTTPEEGGLYFADEWWPGTAGSRWDVYVSGEMSREELGELFGFMGEHGYGRDASTGRGRFAADVGPAPEGLFEAVGNRRMSLSHGTLTANMKDPRYRLEVHCGKLGSLFASGGPVFKKPLTLLRPGATFQPDGGGPFGELIREACPGRPEIWHNAWHLTVAYSEGAED